MWDLVDRDSDNVLVDSNSKITLNETANQIDINLKKGYTFGAKKSDEESEKDYKEGSIKDTFKKAKDGTGVPTGKARYPFMYIFHNLRGLINELEYYINVVHLYHSVGTDGVDSNLYNAYHQLTADQKKFAEDMGVGEKPDEKKQAIYLTATNNNCFALNVYGFDTGAGFQENSYDKLDPEKWSQNNSSHTTNDDSPGFYSGTNNFKGSTLFRIIQAPNSGDQKNPEPGKNGDVNGSYSFINKYIVGIVTKDNYTDYLPDNSPKKSDVKSEGEWLVIKPKTNQYYTARQLYQQLTSQSFSMPMMSVSYAGPNTTNYIPYSDGISGINRVQLNGVNGFNKNAKINDVNVDANIAIINNTAGKSIVQIDDAALTSVICLSVIVLIVGIIVSILYRIPGFILWVSQLTPLALIFLILGIAGHPLTLGTIIAGLLSFIAGTVASIFILNKIKRNHLSHKTMDQAVNNAYLKSIFTTIDVFAVVLLLGIAPIFFPGTSIMMFGLSLIIGSILGFIFTYFMSWLMNWIIFNNGVGMYKNNWLSPIKTSINDPINPQYKTVYDNQMPKFQQLGFTNEGYVSKLKEPFKLTFSKWSNIITWIVIAVITVIGLSIMFTIGIPRSTGFYGGTRLMILIPVGYTESINTYIDPFLNALKANDITGWYGGICDGASHYYVIETTGTYTYESIAQAISAASLSGYNFAVQSIDPAITNELALIAFYVVLIFIGFMFVYGLIRYNWMTIIPNLLVGVFTLATTLAITTIVRVRVDINAVYGVFMSVAITYITMYALLGSMFPRWVKKLHPVYNDLTFLMNYGITVFNDNKILIYIICASAILPSILFMPISMLPMIFVFALGIVIGAILINHCWPLLLRVFVGIHNNWQNRIKQIQLGINKVNLDKVDEELINGININTKEIE